MWMKVDPYCQQQKCRPMTLVSRSIRCMPIFAVFPQRGAPKSPPFQTGSRLNSERLFLRWMRIDGRSRISDWTSQFQDGGHAIISRRKVLPPGQWTSINRLPCANTAAYASSWSIEHSYLLLVYCYARSSNYTNEIHVQTNTESVQCLSKK